MGYLEGQLVVGPGGDDVRVRHLGAYVVQRGQHARARPRRARERRQRRQAQQRARLAHEQLGRLGACTYTHRHASHRTPSQTAFAKTVSSVATQVVFFSSLACVKSNRKTCGDHFSFRISLT